MLACAIISLNAAAVDLNHLKGIPFLAANAEDREHVKNILQTSIMERLKSLENWPDDYARLPKHKAIAIDYDDPTPNGFAPYLYRHEYVRPHVGYWGGAWEYDTLEEARARAIAQCNRDCIVILADDELLITDAMIDAYLTARKDYIESLATKLKTAERLVLMTRDAHSLHTPTTTNSTARSTGSPIASP